MLAESFSDCSVRSADPLDIVRNGRITAGKRLYLVSISGNTASNIRASRTVAHSVAVTASKNSRLDRACSRTILLQYPSSGVFTAGSVGYLASALACISLVSKIRITNAERIFEAARRDASRSRLTGGSFVLGTFLTYPVAMYCAAKFCEILGAASQYERIEQFSHMGLFSARPKDTVLLFEQKSPHAQRLAGNLKKLGLNVVWPQVGGSKIQRILYLVFFSQFLALHEARRRGLRDCYFVTAAKARNASSDMIY